MVKTDTVKGFKDFLGEEARKRVKLKRIIEEQFEKYGFEPAETPIVEFEKFVIGENSNDEAVRDVFRLKDRGDRELALRYEFTFQLKRIAKGQKLPYKRYQIGYNFRDEPIKRGRLRQFIQCDCDIIGSSLKEEAELLSTVQTTFEKLNINPVIYINNRQLVNEILVSENIEEKYREQVIREIDKLDKLKKSEIAKNLEKFNAQKILNIFDGDEKGFEKYKFYEKIKELKTFCKLFNIDVIFKPTLMRGLSYYNGTVFEVWGKDINVSIGGGGSYLVNDMQTTGFSFGLEPISLISKLEGDPIEYLILSLDQDKEAIKVANSLRENEKSVQLMMDKTIKKGLEYANAKNISNVIIIGEEEVKSSEYKVKNMKTGKESKVRF
jgi:histidyl-tRNA synthetase